MNTLFKAPPSNIKPRLQMIHHPKKCISETLKPSFPSASAGFALIIALGLMAFITTLLLGLTTLISVETQNNGIQLNQSKARQNAQLALYMALGDLQKFTGDDQVATGTAELLPDDGPTINELHWTGAWRRTTSASKDPLDLDYEAHPVEAPVWLVSNPKDNPVDPTSALAVPTDDAASQTQWMLRSTVNSANQRVKVPLLDVSSNSNNPSGKIGWWISDQSVKAKINLVDKDVVESASSLTPSFIVSQRNGIENIANDPFAYPSNDLGLERTVNLDQYALLPDAVDATPTNYHDVTPYGLGLPADNLNGGLKRDLTALFFGPSSMVDDMISTGKLVSYNTDRVAPYPQQSGASATNSTWVQSPTWKLLDSYADLSSAIDDAGNLTPRVQSETQHKAGPVLLASSIDFTPFKEQTGPGLFDIRLDFEFTAAIWNPYDVSLSAADYDIEFFIVEKGSRVAAGDTSFIRTTNLSLSQEGGIELDLDEFSTISRINPETNRYESGVGLVFRAPDISLAPGEIVLLSISDASDQTEYDPANGLSTLVRDVVPTRNSVYLKHPNGVGLTEAEIDGNWRIANPKDDERKTTAYVPFLHSAGIRRGDTDIGQTDAYYHQIVGVKGTGKVIFNVTSTSDNPYNPPATDLSPASDNQIYQLHFRYADSLTKRRGIRWLANYDPSATFAMKDSLDLTTNSNANVDSSRDLEGYDFFSRRRSNEKLALKFGSGNAMIPKDGGLESVVLRDLPDSEEALLSIAQLQHANLHDSSYGAPFLIGNSDVEARLPSTDSIARLSPDLPDPNYRNNVDRAWLLNTALYDRFFFSTIPTSGTATPANRRLTQLESAAPTDLRDFEKASSNLFINGAFNVNSTSVEAWKAILSGRNELPVNPANGNYNANGLQNPFSRHSRPSALSNLNDLENKWNGFREFEDPLLDDLAQSIVNEVKQRGPFLSLSDFVNRRVDADTTVSLNGAIQNAIDQTASTNSAFDDINNNNELEDAEDNRIPTNKMIFEAARGNRNENATAWLKQGDVLQAIDSFITTRGDTFLIRAYGNSIDPINQEINAEVWCEALVQRAHNYVDDTNDPGELPYLASAPETDNTGITAINRAFGRRYEIVSLRWLTKDEI